MEKKYTANPGTSLRLSETEKINKELSSWPSAQPAFSRLDKTPDSLLMSNLPVHANIDKIKIMNTKRGGNKIRGRKSKRRQRRSTRRRFW